MVRILVAIMGAILLAGLPATAAPAGPPLQLQGVTKIEALGPVQNLIPDPYFAEVGAGGIPKGWAWDKRNTDATCTGDAAAARVGKRALKFTNGTGFGAHVYGMLWLQQPIPVTPGKAYTLSAYVRADDPGIAWVGGGNAWQFRLHIPPTAGRWQRISLTFTPGEADAAFVPRICTESPTPGFEIEGLKLEEGDSPTPFVPQTDQLLVEPAEAERTIEGDGQFITTFLVYAPKAIHQGESETALDPFGPRDRSLQLQVPQGASRWTITGEATGVDDAPRTLSLKLTPAGAAPVEGRMTLHFVSALSADQRLAALRKRLPALKALLGKVRAAGQDPSYPLVTYTVLENFVGYASEDLHHLAVDGWSWGVMGGAQARFERVAGGHSGEWCARLSNATAAKPNVYGTLALAAPVKLDAGRPYTLSAWVKSDKPGTAWIGGGDGWHVRKVLEPTGGKWKQFALTFTPTAADAEFTARINTDSPTPGILVDDVALVKGDQPDDVPNLIPNGSFEVAHGEVRRSLSQISEMEGMADRLQAELTEAVQGKRKFPAVPRWTGRERPRISGPSFLGPAAFPGQAPVIRPIFFEGYGHFGQVVTDMEKWPAYGTNIIQIEFGPSSVFPKEGETSLDVVKQMRATLDRAQKAGVAVCLLISPHYFPGWALEKYPFLRKHREGFLQYCLHAPQSQELLRRFIADALPPLKDHPVLNSICLSNEPVNVEEPCEFAAKDWHAWLAKRHGDVAALNAHWGSNYAGFDAVPLPNPFASNPPSPLYMDYLRFNQEWFAGWHKMLADAVHAVAPELPVHAKGMTWTFTGDNEVRYGADAELFGGFSQINGNDSCNWYTFGRGEFAQEWQGNAMPYDLQRSVKDAPIFNSENHIILDRDTREVPAAHVRAALWQEAIHGQSATTIWVWERTFDPKSDFAGSIMHRPACAEAVGLTSHDLNRLANEVTAIQRLKPQAVILHSTSARLWDVGRAGDCAGKLYTALSFTGLKLGFVTERQLERGDLPDAPALFVPNVRHLSDAAFAGLKRYKGRLFLVGEEDILSRSEYDRLRDEKLAGEAIPFHYGKTTDRDLLAAVLPKLAAAGIAPAVQVRDEKGEAPWGVSWLCAQTPAGPVVNLCNYGRQPVRVALSRAGAPLKGTDLITGDAVPGTVTLEPLGIRLVRGE